jgi:YegS/Rv2252/BmrU family lipid kinase
MTLEMRRVALIENPISGQSSIRRAAIVRETLSALRNAGIETDHLLIDGPGSGARLASDAMRRGFDTIVVCGGDGTIHEVLQCMVGTKVALGVIPSGTANALAANLGLMRSPSKAVSGLIASRRVDVRVGRILYRDQEGMERSRYFTVAAGVGADALLMSRLDPALKRRFGYALYMVEAFRIWATHTFPLFRATFTSHDKSRQEDISQLLAVRVRSFGGALGRLAPGASLLSGSLSMVMFKTRSRWRYFRFSAAVLAGRQTFSHDVELIEADAVDCVSIAGAGAPVFVEADGEVLGHLPMRLEIAEQTLTLLIPPDAQP